MDKELRPIEIETLAQGDRAPEWLSRNLNPSILILDHTHSRNMFTNALLTYFISQ